MCPILCHVLRPVLHLARVLSSLSWSVSCPPCPGPCPVLRALVRVLSSVPWSVSCLHCPGPCPVLPALVRVLSSLPWSVSCPPCPGPCPVLPALVRVLSSLPWSVSCPPCPGPLSCPPCPGPCPVLPALVRVLSSPLPCTLTRPLSARRQKMAALLFLACSLAVTVVGAHVNHRGTCQPLNTTMDNFEPTRVSSTYIATSLSLTCRP